jgi:formylglycine-generating enzyme required for sulfatase activity
MAEPVLLKYRAFISYSHADTAWAKWLHRGLEGFRIDKDLAGRETATGTIPKSLRPIFRDREDFTAGHSLNDQTLAALDASHALIVICSPSSAKSAYVTEEIRLYKSRHPERPVVPLIVDGRPSDPNLECFPPSLKFELDANGEITAEPVELLAADAREEGDGRQLALAKVVASLVGVPSDDIFRRAERERRAAARRRRWVRGLVATLGLLLLVGGIGWLNQDYLKEQYYWRAMMGPQVLTPVQEIALNPREKFKECATGCPEMVVLPTGSFMMGTDVAIVDINMNEDESPQHKVDITRSFAVGKYEVTFAEWDACVAAGACQAVPDNDWGREIRPVINVSWNEAQDYVDWLTRITGKTYRLLSEAEWEYAAQSIKPAASSKSDESISDEVRLANFEEDNDETERALDPYVWYRANSGGKTQPVGGKKPNALGLYDLYGNV